MPVAIEAAQTGVTEGKAAHAVVHVVAALHQQLERRRAAGRDRLLEHRGLHRVDDGEDELLAAGHGAQRRMRRPAYFSPSRRRPPASSQTRAPITSSASGGKRMREPGGAERGALGVDGQRARRLVVEPPRARG